MNVGELVEALDDYGEHLPVIVRDVNGQEYSFVIDSGPGQSDGIATVFIDCDAEIVAEE